MRKPWPFCGVGGLWSEMRRDREGMEGGGGRRLRVVDILGGGPRVTSMDVHDSCPVAFHSIRPPPQNRYLEVLLLHVHAALAAEELGLAKHVVPLREEAGAVPTFPQVVELSAGGGGGVWVRSLVHGGLVRGVEWSVRVYYHYTKGTVHPSIYPLSDGRRLARTPRFDGRMHARTHAPHLDDGVG